MIEIKERSNIINCTTCEHSNVCKYIDEAQTFEVSDIPHFITVSVNCINYKQKEVNPIKIN